MGEKKFNVILDLDLTLICAEPIKSFGLKKHREKIKAFDPKFDITTLSYPDDVPIRDRRILIIEDYYIVFLRPHLQEFLDFLFKNFNVGVWTAASKDYALFIIKHAVLLLNEDESPSLPKESQRFLDFIFFYYHCGISKKLHTGSKNLKLVYDVFDTYNENNTVIIDDCQEVHDIQSSVCIHAKEFQISTDNAGDDTFLLDVIEELKTRFNVKDQVLKDQVLKDQVLKDQVLSPHTKKIRKRTKLDIS